MSGPTLLPAVVFPLHDPQGVVLAHLSDAQGALKAAFSRAFVTISAPTREAHPERIRALAADSYYEIVPSPPDTSVGDHFLSAYARAAACSSPEQQLHLCTADRLVYALAGEHRAAFLADLQAAAPSACPILYQRSALAWSTHPPSYHAVEAMATRAGQVLFGCEYDYAWCHMAIRCATLQAILPRIRHPHDFRFLAEMVLLLRDTLVTREVDWLAWEDPYILAREAKSLRAERERDPAELEKRLGYVVPIVRTLVAYATEGET